MKLLTKSFTVLFYSYSDSHTVLLFIGLLIMQSLSGIILSRNEALLTNHPVIIYYLTMMVGAGRFQIKQSKRRTYTVLIVVGV
ncbi:MAG: hypothetical protein ACI8RD_012634 [Bacillariaceae sp.]|jgi:hypothetical protein